MSTVDDFDPDPSRPGYLFQRMAEHLAGRIAAGELPPGGRLPNHQDLAAEYRVSTNTVVRALDVLRERGLVVTYQYKGSYVAEELPPAGDGVTG